MYMHFYMFYLLSSPYLLVFGDDRVRGTWVDDVVAGGSGEA